MESVLLGFSEDMWGTSASQSGVLAVVVKAGTVCLREGGTFSAREVGLAILIKTFPFGCLLLARGSFLLKRSSVLGPVSQRFHVLLLHVFLTLLIGSHWIDVVMLML